MRTDGPTVSNFVSLDFEDIGHQDGSNAITGTNDSHSFEFYGVFRTVLSGNKIFETNAFSWGPIKDIGLELGGDPGHPERRLRLLQAAARRWPAILDRHPEGFWTATIAVSHEWDTDAFLPNGNGTNFNPTYYIESAWLYPFNIGPVPLKFTGFLNIIGPKGLGAPATPTIASKSCSIRS